MKDGYYLSAYIHIDELSHLERIKMRHDQNLSLWLKRGDNISLVHYWELERLTGIKRHGISFRSVEQALEVICGLLSRYGLAYSDIVQVWGTPQLPGYYELPLDPEWGNVSFHSIAHLFSAVCINSDTFFGDNIIGMAVDGGPDCVIDSDLADKSLYSGCISRKGRMEVFPVSSPGLIWVYVRKKYYDLREGSLMALAGASKSELIAPDPEPFVFEKMKDWHSVTSYVDELVNTVNGLTEKDSGKLFNGFDERFSVSENRISMVMKRIQTLSRRILEMNIDRILDRFQADPKEFCLALAGGYALNCPTNTYLMKKYGFKGFIAPPNVSDTGQSLGIALFAFYKQTERFRFSLRHAYYGNTGSRAPVSERSPYRRHIGDVSVLDFTRAAQDIRRGPVVWFNGAAEIGPRALGNRSILADPASDTSRDVLNRIKQRQWWRPVAPVVLEEEVGEWFENARPSPFMLQTFDVKQEKLDIVPAVAHLDRSARVQTVNEQQNKALYRLLRAFKNEYGIPMLCNTSLNDRGEPIIDSIEEALNFALRKGFRVIYINGTRVELKDHELFEATEPAARPLEILFAKKDGDDELRRRLNPFSATADTLAFYNGNPVLKSRYSLQNKDDVRIISLYASMEKSKLGVAPGI